MWQKDLLRHFTVYWTGILNYFSFPFIGHPLTDKMHMYVNCSYGQFD